MGKYLNKFRRLLYILIPIRLRRDVKRVLFGRPKICPSLYTWVKANPKYAEIVKEFWTSHQTRRGVPKSLDSSIPPPSIFVHNIDCHIYEKALFRIKNVTMRGKEGVFFLPDGTVTHQTGWALEHVTATAAYKNKWKGKGIFKKGNFSPLILYWGLGYYHWFTDVLAMLHNTLEIMPKDTIFLMPEGSDQGSNGDFYLKSLKALGIDRDRVQEFNGTESWTFQNFWWQPPAVHPGDQTPGAAQWIGQRISNSVPKSSDEKPVKIYISRVLPYARILVNEEKILSQLQDLGFQICLLEQMPFEEQVRLFRNADVVAGPHGAGFTNLIFSKPGTRVVEILPKGHERRCYWTLCAELGHEYRCYLGDPKFPARKGDPDIEIDNHSFLSALSKFINL